MRGEKLEQKEANTPVRKLNGFLKNCSPAAKQSMIFMGWGRYGTSRWEKVFF